MGGGDMESFSVWDGNGERGRLREDGLRLVGVTTSGGESGERTGWREDKAGSALAENAQLAEAGREGSL